MANGRPHGLSIPLNVSVGNQVFNHGATWQFTDEANQPVYQFDGAQVATRRISGNGYLLIRNVDSSGTTDIGPNGLRFSGIRVMAEIPNLVSQNPAVAIQSADVHFSLSGVNFRDAFDFVERGARATKMKCAPSLLFFCLQVHRCD